MDFKKHGESMGALAFYARTENEIRAALDAGRAHDGVTVIHVAVSPDKRAPGYDSWWDVPVAAVSASETVNAARERYEEKVTAQRAELL